MSNISIRVELPGHSHSFMLDVPDTSTIRSIKAEIAKTCPGGPRVEGQRLIYRGRLLTDEEHVQDIRAASLLQDSLIVHLAVHPSAWTTTPPGQQSSIPSIPPALSRLPSAFNGPTPTLQSQPTAFPNSQSYSMPFSSFTGYHNTSVSPTPFISPAHVHPFITYKHECAIAALTANSSISLPSYTPDVLEVARSSAISMLQSYGWSWPPVFDEPIPSANQGDGAKYERVVVCGQNYLELKTPHAQPTALQMHALRTLSYTYSILTITSAPTAPYNPYYFNPATQYPGVQDLNPRLQNLGLPPLRVAENGLAGDQMHAIPVRAIMASLIMLTLRTLFLVYFFAPSRTPLIGLLVGAWIAYEVWNAFRIGLRGRGRGEQRGAVPVQGNVDPAQQPNARLHQEGAPGGTASNHARVQTSYVLDTLANVNLGFENDALSAAAQARLGTPSEPGLMHKIQTFAMLLVTTVHPALWNRRRAELMRREGRIRTEAAALQPGNGDAETTEGAHATETDRRTQARLELRELNERRPVWVREYVERVRNAEFPDE